VQHKLGEEAPEIKDTAAFVGGKDAMIEEFTTELVRMGMSPNRIFINT